MCSMLSASGAVVVAVVVVEGVKPPDIGCGVIGWVAGVATIEVGEEVATLAGPM